MKKESKEAIRYIKANRLRKFIKKNFNIRISLPLSYQMIKAIEKGILPTFLTDKCLDKLYHRLYIVYLDKYDYWNYIPTKYYDKLLKEINFEKIEQLNKKEV